MEQQRSRPGFLTAYRRLLILVLLVGIVISAVRAAEWLPERGRCNDFAVHYLTSRLYLEGVNPYGIDLGPYYSARGFEFDPVIHTATNPPTLVAFFSLFCPADSNLGFVAWIAFQTLCLVGVLEILRRHFSLSWLAWFTLGGLLLISDPLEKHYFYAQVQLLLLFLVYFGFMCVRRERYTLGCALVAAAGVLKLYPFVLLPWFLWQGNDSAKKKVCRAAAILGGTMWLMVLPGLDMWLGFAKYGMPLISDMAAVITENNSIPSTLLQFSCVFTGRLPSDELQLIATMVGLAIIGAAYLVCIVRERRTGERNAADCEFSLLLTAMIGGGMTAWTHYYVFLLFPLVFLARQFESRSFAYKCTYVSSLVFIILAFEPPAANLLVEISTRSLPTLSIIALLVLIGKPMIDKEEVIQWAKGWRSRFWFQMSSKGDVVGSQ